jgi:hypothetical protein
MIYSSPPQARIQVLDSSDYPDCADEFWSINFRLKFIASCQISGKIIGKGMPVRERDTLGPAG